MLEVLELNSTLSCELKVCGHASNLKTYVVLMTVLVNNPKISWTIIVRKMGDSLFGILRSIKQVYQVNGGRLKQ